MECFGKKQETVASDPMQTLPYWQSKCNRDLKLSLKELHQYSRKFEDNCDRKTKKINLTKFRAMLGIIGASFIGERLFEVIRKSRRHVTFELSDYLVY